MKPTDQTQTSAASPTTNPIGVLNAAPGYKVVQGVDGNGMQYNTTVPDNTPPKVSTTTISNANKQAIVPSIQAKTQQLAQTGVTTDPNTGMSTTANGSLYTPPDTSQSKPSDNSGISKGGYVGDVWYPAGATLPQDANGNYSTTADSSPADTQIMSGLNNLLTQTDAQTASTIQGIQSQYAQLIQQQQAANQGQQKSVSNALLNGGVTGQGSSSQYAPISSSGIISAQVNYGIQQISDLQAKENAAIAAAQAAGLSNKFQVQQQINNEISKIRDQKVEAATKLNDTIAAQNAKLAEQAQASALDSAITDLYSGGYTSVPDILSQLKSQGISATSADVANVLKNTGVDDIQKIAADASANGAPLSVIQTIGQAKSPAEALQAAGQYTANALDVEYKKAQIAKIYKDMSDSGIAGQDAASVLAYAQQYASTGAIPTGLPKGSFGVVSQVARDLPKQNGQIIDNATGVTSSKLSGDQLKGVTGLYDAVTKVAEIQKQYELARSGGASSVSEAYNNKVVYLQLKDEFTDAIARSRTGAVIGPEEAATYNAKLPNLNNLAGGEAKFSSILSSLQQKLNSQLVNNGASIYGYSKIKTPIGEKTVGETITLPNGVSGRVNPDGTINPLQ